MFEDVVFHVYFIRSTGDLILKTDASNLAFGGTLTQIQSDENGAIVERDIAFEDLF